MNTPKHTTGAATAVLLLAGLVWMPPVNAEDCYLDTDNNGTGDSTAGANSSGLGTRLACGTNATATGSFSTAVGSSTNATGGSSTAVGNSTNATGGHSTAVGTSADATGHSSTAVGASTNATGDRSTAVGAFADAQAFGSTALGAGADVLTPDARGAIAIGISAEVSGTAPGAIAIGGDADIDFFGAQATAVNAIAIGADAVASVANTVILGSPSATTWVGVNTSTPSNELDIRSHSPAIRLDDISADQGRVDLDMNANEFAIEGNSNQDIVEIDTRAPLHALTVRRNGNVGVGLFSPVADLHVRGEGSGNVEELLRLESRVPPRMMLRNSKTKKNWTLSMTAKNHLILSHGGTGKTEATFFKNGNLKITGNLNQGSDRHNKQAIMPVDSVSVLETVAKLPISTWEYKGQDGVKHIGPMAQNFHAAFGLGDDPKGISSIDTGGVALAAIKGLNEVGQSRDKVIAIQNEKIKSLTAANKELTARLTMLENLVNKLAAKEVVMNP